MARFDDISSFALCAECVGDFHAQNEAPTADCAPGQRDLPSARAHTVSCKSSTRIANVVTTTGDL